MNECILIIDDEALMRSIAAKMLKNAGYDVIQADNGKTGISMASQMKPDLILCDIMMPELDGFDVLQSLNKNQETAIIPFIFLTARTERVDFRKGMEMGADDYIIKPFNHSELLNAIQGRLKKNEIRKVSFTKALQNLDNLANSSKDEKAELKALIASRKIRHVKKKQILYYDGDQPMGIYLILDGCIKTIKFSDDGREFMTGLYKTDNYLGVNALLLNEAFKETAIAVEDATVCLLPKDIILSLLTRYPAISQQFLRMLSNNIAEKEDQMLELAYNSVRKRLAQVLLRLNKQSDDPRLLKISREELAGMAGMAMETVSRTLTNFKDEGLIDKKSGHITILELNRLEKIKN
ncbi:response regulator [Mucilaginibacter sp. SP1R1]|uniref:response regulator n=1 Tax=Mucilaginibacter sp. SP1R1 TaxID=2723091 RepID=UPI0016125D10|nr:response regulator [Mucilaginibacter sp. SP1R1]MBB6151126.1 DNA-binding response OmpR family regulator [Mucilaginibacter sp. SP1R1]